MGLQPFAQVLAFVLLVELVLGTYGVFPLVGCIVEATAIVDAGVGVERKSMDVVFYGQLGAKNPFVFRAAGRLVVNLGEWLFLVGRSLGVDCVLVVDSVVVLVVVVDCGTVVLGCIAIVGVCQAVNGIETRACRTPLVERR